MDYPSFLKAFQEAHGLKILDKDITSLECHTVNNLVVTSGKLLACDPYYCPETEPFDARPIPPGQYPVILVVAHIGKSDQRVALAALKISDAAPVRWEIATPVGWNPTRRSGYTYCVDSGIGCFMDADPASLEFAVTY